jgi:hypothetical protein
MEFYSVRPVRLRTAESAASPTPISASGICDKIRQRAAEVILGRIDMPDRGLWPRSQNIGEWLHPSRRIASDALPDEVQGRY